MSDYVAPVAAILLPHLGAVAGGIFARRNLDVWYEGLKYPSWRPPNKIFPVVWTTLYSSMGYASYLVWKDGGGFRGRAAAPLALYGTQLALNWAWTPIFFGLRSPKLAFVDSVCLFGGIAGTIIMFHRVNEAAAYLLFPYLGWVAFATALNYRIWRDNPEPKEEIYTMGSSLVLQSSCTVLSFSLCDLWEETGAHLEAFVDSVCLFGGIAGTIIMFHRVNEAAAYLLFPYLGWVAFATALNYRIWRDNPEPKEE